MEVITVGIGAMLSDPMCFVVLLFGVLMGIIFGLGVALMIPITYTMTAHQGLTLLIAIYVGGISGGLITATLINIPGTPSSIFTCYDGYPMTKAGKPGEALTIGVFASLIGGTASALALILIAPQLAKVVLAFGSWEYFAVCILGLAVVITMSCEDVVKGLIGALLVVTVEAILPYALAFAAGAMILVAVHELIPECQQNQKEQPYCATMGIILGFAVMMLLDVMLG